MELRQDARVFVPRTTAKGAADGARVLRSGRRSLNLSIN